MKNLLYGTVLSLLLCLPWCTSLAQQGGISIGGKITDHADGQPLRVVSVSVNKKGLGTATNASGLFTLLIPAANLHDTLRISHIGYQTKKLAIADLQPGVQLDIALDRSINQLKQVDIAYYDAPKIIAKAISRIADNYINHPHVIRGFYRMYTYNDQDPLQLSEAVFDIYNFGYADKRADLFRLVKARSEKNERDFGTLELGQKPNSVFEADIINHIFASGLLNKAGLENHKFEVKGIVEINGYRAYQIDFEEKPDVLDRTYRGTMYVETKTYAFIHFDYGLSPSGLDALGYGSFAKHAVIGSRSAQLDLTHDHTVVSYQEVGNKWVLSGAEGDDVLNVQDSVLNKNYVAHVKFNYQVTSVDTTKSESFNTKMGRNENIGEHDNDDSESYWKTYNILLSDYNAEDIFKQIRAINKANKQKGK